MIKWYIACSFSWSKTNIERFKHHKYTTVNFIPGQAYYTKNDSCALKNVLKVRRWRLSIKIKEIPFAEGNND